MGIKDDVIAAITDHQIKIDRLELLLTCEAVLVKVNNRLSVRVSKPVAFELVSNESPALFEVLETLTGFDIHIGFA